MIKKRTSVAALLVLIALVAAGCGSSSKKSTNSSGNTTATTAAGGSTSGTDNVQKAKDIVAKAQQRPTSLGFTKPVGAPIPTGKKLYFINCGASACNLEGNIIKTATDTLGWTEKTLNTDGTPQQVQAAWEQVIREKPDAVLYTATPRSEIDKYLKQAKAMNIGVAACCLTDPLGDGIDYNISNPEQSAALAPVWAAWVTSNSNGKGKAAFYTLPDFPILKAGQEAFTKSIADMCPGCSADVQNVPLADIGKNAPDLVVSYLRAHPDVKYLVMSVDVLVLGLPAALKAAGLNDINIIGEGPDTTNLQYISSGQQNASLAFPYYEDMYGMVDAMARKFAGVPIEPSFSPPLWLLTKDNVPSTTQLFPLVADTPQQFAKLWGKA